MTNRKPDKVIKDDKGNIIIEVYGQLNVDVFVRCLLGMKQEVKKTV